MRSSTRFGRVSILRTINGAFQGVIMWSYTGGTWSALVATVLARLVIVLLGILAEPTWGASIASGHGHIQARETYDWLSPVYQGFFTSPLPIPPDAQIMTSYYNSTTDTWIDFYEIHIQKFQQNIYPNLRPTNLIGYNGTSPGPTFRITKNREAVIRFVNQNDQPAAVHLHGSYSRAPFDGWAEDLINPGEYKDYYYPNSQPARTLWYHDHAMEITALNTLRGQAGLYILSDTEQEVKLALPDSVYEIPLVLQSKQYQSNGDLVLPGQQQGGLYGDVIHVNGQPWPYLHVEPRKYRIRILNAAISRPFLLSVVPQTGGSNCTAPLTMQVIAGDAGYFEAPVLTTSLYISMGERFEVIIDFSPYAGEIILLKNARNVFMALDFFGTDQVMQFRVSRNVTSDNRNNWAPASIARLNLPPIKSVVDRNFAFDRINGSWTINGVGFADARNRILAKPERGNVELWQFENKSGIWSHPVHIHLVDFKIIQRVGGRGQVMPYERAGMKDIGMIGPNETLQVVAKYAPWDGVYMFHCHNLVHEDHDMMGAFNISALSLSDFGYPETTKFIDPMEQRWRAKPWPGTSDLHKVLIETLPAFSSLDAYHSAEHIQDALDAYWNFP